MPQKPFKRETVFKGRAFAVERQHVHIDMEHDSTFEIVIHPGAVAIIPVDEQGNIWFVSQFRYGADQDLLEIPAGTLKPGEDPAAAAGREIREETGMAAEKMEKLGEFFMAPGYSSEYIHIYLATGLYSSPLDKDEDEFIVLEKIPYKDAYAMARQGEFNDGKTLAALFLAIGHPLLPL